MEHSFGTRLIGFWYEFAGRELAEHQCGHHSRECEHLPWQFLYH